MIQMTRLTDTLKNHRSHGFDVQLRKSPEVNGKERVRIIVRKNGKEIRTVDRLDTCPQVITAAVAALN